MEAQGSGPGLNTALAQGLLLLLLRRRGPQQGPSFCRKLGGNSTVNWEVGYRDA